MEEVEFWRNDMVKILQISEIDEIKLEELFQTRGHKSIIPEYFEKVENALLNENGFEVHQCDCGELIIIHEDLVKKLSSDIVKCKKCSPSEIPGIVSFGLFIRLDAIGDLLNDMYKDESDIIRLQDDVIEKIQDISDGLMAANDFDEIIYSYKYTVDIATSIVTYMGGNNKNKEYEKNILSFIKLAILTNPLVVNNFLSDRNEMISVRNSNIINTQSLIQNIRPENNLLMKQYKEDKYLKISKIEAKMKLYINCIEGDHYLKYILNIFNVINGIQWSSEPFNKLITTKKGKIIDINDLHGRVEYLLSNIKIFNIDKMINESYNSKLRNAIAHNQYNIFPEKNIIELIKYKIIITFDEFENYVENIRSLHLAIDDSRINAYLDDLKPEMKDKGIYSIKFEFSDENDVVVNIYQYWCFSFFNNEIRYIPTPKFRINIPLQCMDIYFEDGGFSYNIPIGLNELKIISKLIENQSYLINLHTITPILYDYKNDNITEINGFKFLINGPYSDIKEIDTESLENILFNINLIMPNNSPLNDDNLTKFDLRYSKEELKNIVEDKYNSMPDFPLDNMDLHEMQVFFPGKDEEEIRKIIALPFSTKSTLSKYYPQKLEKHSYFIILQKDDEDVQLFDIKNLTIVYVEIDNCPKDIFPGELIWAKLISYPKEKYSCIWNFLEIKKYIGDMSYINKWRESIGF